jgi:hypothetical protein
MEEMLSFNELHTHSTRHIYCFRFSGVEEIRSEQVEQPEMGQLLPFFLFHDRTLSIVAGT